MSFTDPFAVQRGHALISPELARDLPPLGTHDETELDEIRQMTPEITLYSITTGWRWHILEYDPHTGDATGLVEGNFTEWGPFEFSKLCGRTTDRPPVADIRRDRSRGTRTFGQILDEGERKLKECLSS